MLLSLLPSVSETETAPRPKMLQEPDAREESHENGPEKKDMSNASTVPVKRRLVWGEEEATEEKENQQSTEEEEKENEKAAVVVQNLEENSKETNEDNKVEG